MHGTQTAIELCWTNALCVAGAVALLTSVVAAARRLQSIDQWPRKDVRFLRVARVCFVGATFSGAASFALCLIGASKWPQELKTVGAITILISIALDWSSDSASAFLRSVLDTAMITVLSMRFPGLDLTRLQGLFDQAQSRRSAGRQSSDLRDSQFGDGSSSAVESTPHKPGEH